MTAGKHSLNLAYEARKRWGFRCPCCGVRMRTKRTRAGQRLPRDQETIGHDQSVAKGGDPNVWVFICHECNQEQGPRSFAVWASVLAWRGDERALRVRELADWLAERLNKGRKAA